MKRLCETMKYALIWLCRFRNRRGYNVHSPADFHLITRVFFETEPYYAYADLHHRYGHGRTPRQEKVSRLLLRLSNEVQPRHGAVCGAGWEAEEAYLSAGCRRLHLAHVPTVEALPPLAPLGFLLLRAEALPPDVSGLMALAASGGLFVVWGIHGSRSARRRWRSVERCPGAIITFDLYDVGLVFFPPGRFKQAYRVCF